MGRIHTVEIPDWAARHKFADMILRLRDAYPAQEVGITATAMTYEEWLGEITARKGTGQ